VQVTVDEVVLQHHLQHGSVTQHCQLLVMWALTAAICNVPARHNGTSDLFRSLKKEEKEKITLVSGHNGSLGGSPEFRSLTAAACHVDCQHCCLLCVCQVYTVLTIEGKDGVNERQLLVVWTLSALPSAVYLPGIHTHCTGMERQFQSSSYVWPGS